MERGFDGLFNHVTPNVSDEALITRLTQIVELVEQADLTPAEVADFQREVNHIVWEVNIRKAAKVKQEEEIAWMEKLYGEESDDGRK